MLLASAYAGQHSSCAIRTLLASWLGSRSAGSSTLDRVARTAPRPFWRCAARPDGGSFGGCPGGSTVTASHIAAVAAAGLGTGRNGGRGRRALLPTEGKTHEAQNRSRRHPRAEPRRRDRGRHGEHRKRGQGPLPVVLPAATDVAAHSRPGPLECLDRRSGASTSATGRSERRAPRRALRWGSSTPTP